MRDSLFFLFFLLAFSNNIKSQFYDKNCYNGINFEISRNLNWGFGEPVITEIEPGSPAEKMGLRANDIIMEINGKATYLRDNETIANWLFANMTIPEVSFTIRNINDNFREYHLDRKCVAVNSISEKDLSSIFSYYSVENSNQRIFSLPLQVHPTDSVDFTDYHTFDFYIPRSNPPSIDTYITSLLEKQLKEKGLERDTKDPDIVVQLYYKYEQNPQFNGLKKSNIGSKSWRYSIEKEEMLELPIFQIDVPNAEAICRNSIELGISFYDRKYINPKKMTQIWEAKIEDFLSGNYSFEEYAKLHIPLMMKQYPYSNAKNITKYFVEFKKYNYTGIHFDLDDWSAIKDVDEDSPAYKAGIRPGYLIKKLNNHKFTYTKEAILQAYQKFVAETMSYRDKTTAFTDVKGMSCMFWDLGYYPQITKEFDKSEYLTLFSYLYDFESYVSNKKANNMVIEAWDGKQMRTFNVLPEVRKIIIIKSL